jgi:hypothetical protein
MRRRIEPGELPRIFTVTDPCCLAPYDASLSGMSASCLRIAKVLSLPARSGVERPQVTIEAVSRLERPGGPAKLKRFVSLAGNLGAPAGTCEDASPGSGRRDVVGAGR